MALDEALMDRARATGEWVARVYSWSTPTLSLGRNQTARGRYRLDEIERRGLAVVRRPTGGRAIVHHREITYSVTGPAESAGSLRQSYERINTVVVNTLRGVGVSPHVQSASGTVRNSAPGMTPCFDEPAPGELTVAGRKLAGSAQWRCDGALLQHGSILVDDDQSLLAELSLAEQRPVPRPATLAEILGRAPTPADLAAAMSTAVREMEHADAAILEIDDQLRARAEALVVRYLDAAWTWRR